MSLANQFAAYSVWRSRLATNIGELQSWLNHNELSDAQSDLRLTQLLERLREDRLNVAFVAEFSRGKSELINAIFFADYGNRMLPSSAGRTTMYRFITRNKYGNKLFRRVMKNPDRLIAFGNGLMKLKLLDEKKIRFLIYNMEN